MSRLLIFASRSEPAPSVRLRPPVREQGCPFKCELPPLARALRLARGCTPRDDALLREDTPRAYPENARVLVTLRQCGAK